MKENNLNSMRADKAMIHEPTGGFHGVPQPSSIYSKTSTLTWLQYDA